MVVVDRIEIDVIGRQRVPHRREMAERLDRPARREIDGQRRELRAAVGRGLDARETRTRLGLVTAAREEKRERQEQGRGGAHAEGNVFSMHPARQRRKLMVAESGLSWGER